MERLQYIIVAATAALSFVGCEKPVQPEPQEGEFKIERLRDVGKEIPNPTIDISDCIPEGSQETLESVRYIEGKTIYYMDYTAKVDWGSLLTQPGNERYPVFWLEQLTDKVSTALFKNPISKGDVSRLGGACSGFICYNSKGEMLNGRNYDGSEGEMVIIFNKNVKAGEHKSVMMTDLYGAQTLSGLGQEYAGDKALLKPGKELNVLLRQPIMIIDGMNDAGLVLTSYQLSDFNYEGRPEDPFPSETQRPEGIYQNTGKPQAGFMGLHYLALTTCETVEDVVDLFKSYDFSALTPTINMHWCFSDANNKWLTLEYWIDENGKDTLYVYDEEDRHYSATIGGHHIAYEYLSMENYYYNPVLAINWHNDYWQREIGAVMRVNNMMGHFSPVMDEEEALSVLQYGNFGIEYPGQVTNWSCVYNSKQRTILFNVRDQADRAFTIDLKKDL